MNDGQRELRDALAARRLGAHRVEELQHPIDGASRGRGGREHLHHRTVLILDDQDPALIGLSNAVVRRADRRWSDHRTR